VFHNFPSGRQLRSVLPRALTSLIFVGASTWLAFHFRLNLATTGFLYLILVIASAIRDGFWFATATSFISALCLNYFFAPPLFSLSVSDPANWIALSVFELTALVISRLSKIAKDRTTEAIRERRDAERLYNVSLGIFAKRSQDSGNMLATVIRECFDLKAVVLFDAMSGHTYSAVSTATARAGTEAEASPDMALAEEGARRVFLRDSHEFDAARESSFCVLRSNLRPAGGLALCGPGVRPLIAAALASLCELSLDRYRSFERECHAEAVRQTEQLRAAVLDSLAHQIKTPVSTIWAASSGLLSLGGLSETQELLVGLMDEQSKKLTGIASQLLTTAKLDTPGIAPKRELLRLSEVVDETVHALDRQQSQTRLRVSYADEEMPVLGDRKLISDAVGQIINNALKYSTRDTPITIRVGLGNAGAMVSVQNEGPTIEPSDRDRIFDRFYRSNPIRQKSSGSGLGLSIVKRVVEAHEGKVWVESQMGTTTFSLALPLAPKEAVASSPAEVRAAQAAKLN
jgi:two-component system sensor histidine kinase KdpD